MCRTDSFEKTLMLGKIEGRRRRGWQRMRGWVASPTQCTWVWESPGVGDGQGGLACWSPWGRKESHLMEWLNWTESSVASEDNRKHAQLLSHFQLFWRYGLSLPGSSVYGISQARILEWVAIPFSRRSSRPRNQTWVSCIWGRFFTIWARHLGQ